MVEVGTPNAVENDQVDVVREKEEEVQRRRDSDNQETSTSDIPVEDVSSLEVAFMYDAPMREMTVCVTSDL